MQITKKTVQDKVIGYKCDCCKKDIIFGVEMIPQENYLIWSHPAGGFAEGFVEERIDFCSPKCFLKLLNGIYYGTDIHLSSDFLNDFRKLVYDRRKNDNS